MGRKKKKEVRILKNRIDKVPNIEVVIEDRERNKKIVIAQYPKSIILPESYCEDMAEVIFSFLKKNTGKFTGKIKKDFKNFVFYEKMVNKQPFEVKNNNNNFKKRKTKYRNSKKLTFLRKR